MNTLYDVLGIGKQATPTQIEQAYRMCVESLADSGEQASSDDGLIRAKAIKEAYSVLSSPTRRQAYDQKLKSRETVDYEVVAEKKSPVLAIVLSVVLLIAALGYYKIQAHEAEVERIAAEAAKAKADADHAAALAAAEQAKLQAQLDQESQQRARTEAMQTDQARREGQQVHNELVRAMQDKDRADRQAQLQAQQDQQRQDMIAQSKARNDLIALQRALNMPIPRR